MTINTNYALQAYNTNNLRRNDDVMAKAGMILSVVQYGLNILDNLTCYVAEPSVTSGGGDTKVKTEKSEKNKQNEENKKPEESKKPEEVIANALEKAGIDYESQSSELKSHILNKYDMMMRMYGDNKPDDSIIDQRLVNYAKGYKFHQFELLAGQGAAVDDYKLDTSNTEDKKAKYLEFGKQYVEIYDNNGDGKADIWEIFHQELIEHYMITERMDSQTARTKAINAVEKYSGMSPVEINASTDDSVEMQLLKAVMTKVASISEPLIEESDFSNITKAQEILENMQSISQEEAATLAVTYANFIDSDANISSSEYINTEMGIAGAEDNRRNKFIEYMKHSHKLLQ